MAHIWAWKASVVQVIGLNIVDMYTVIWHLFAKELHEDQDDGNPEDLNSSCMEAGYIAGKQKKVDPRDSQEILKTES